MNAKTQRPSVCNAVETVLVLRGAAERLIPGLVETLQAHGVTVHGDPAVAALAAGIVSATEEDWATEYLSLDLAVRVVDSLDEALDHIQAYSTGHTEAIVTADSRNADRFLAEVDSAVVMVNASTRPRVHAFRRRRRVRLRRRGGYLDTEAARQGRWGFRS